MYTICVLYLYNVRTMPLHHVCDVYNIFVHCVYTDSSINIPQYTINVQYIGNVCTKLIECVWNTYTICMQYVHNTCTMCVQSLYNVCSIPVHYVHNMYAILEQCVYNTYTI